MFHRDKDRLCPERGAVDSDVKVGGFQGQFCFLSATTIIKYDASPLIDNNNK